MHLQFWKIFKDYAPDVAPKPIAEARLIGTILIGVTDTAARIGEDNPSLGLTNDPF
jgi:hypothetical protein